MTSRRARSNLFVSLASLAASLVDLVTYAVRLVVAVLAWALRAVEHRTRERRVAPTPAQKPSVIAPAPIPTVAGPTPEETLYNCLVSLGFQAPRVRRFVASVGPRAGQAPMADLIKEGLRALAS
jgi:hypothetical protein